MSFRPMLQRRAVAPIAATLLAGGIVAYPRRTVYAEAPSDLRKPIYDDYPSELSSEPIQLPNTSLSLAPSSETQSTEPPSVTDLLEGQVRRARLFLYAHSLAAENAFNDFLSRVLRIENAFTDTVASLAPSAESGERLLPGGIYVVVSAMAGSIVSRNRGIVLRSATPLAFGTVAAWTLLPVTMRNVSDFLWEYEKKVPAVADNHLKARNFIEHTYTTGVAHSQMGRVMLEDKIGEIRESLEKWISKGR
ncbi:putative mitochondrial protein [Talaromyces proteolyticus]|uniref:MICOS complex subunit n=1 Tax=Talaromyces proteolyticus TaxID=1131652 RepID=A0AAD4KZQ2_9EURO|nr:putative mitochondrial protein [Talaromyces proteolyticus]KAH8704883.1 putative mitochondrial protein [Talaromyces proteolyticus]